MEDLASFLKEQVMVNPYVSASYLIGVEVPTILLEFLNCFTNIPMMLNLYTDPFLHSITVRNAKKKNGLKTWLKRS